MTDRRGRPSTRIIVSPSERATLEQWIRRRGHQLKDWRFARALSSASTSARTDVAVARELHLHRLTVGHWRRRFQEARLDGLLDEPRPGAPRRITDAMVERVITDTLESMPRDATALDTRSMAKATGLSQSAVARIWKAFALQPHRVDTFKLSEGFPSSSTRCATSWGCTSPRRSAPWCCASTRNLRSKRWIAPPPSCRCGRAKPNGARTTTCAMAPRRSLRRSTSRPARSSGSVMRGTGALEFRRFLDTIEAAVPSDLDVHLIPRQLCDAQDRRDSSLVGQTAAISRPLHPDERVVAQSRRAVVCGTDRQANPSGHPPEHARSGRGHSDVPRRHQRHAQTVRVA